MIQDRWGRAIRYLRVSVTDRCNLRCAYCMPAEGFQLRPHEEILRYEEIAAVVEAAAAAGVRRVRLTGGEPLARKGIAELVGFIAGIPEIEDISLTTNGILLEQMAAELKDAGLNRVNVSLDTLDPDKFTRITRGGSLAAVLRGLAAAEAAGLSPVKINAVAMRGVNDEEMADMARLTLDHPWHVRFIELMPVENQHAWGEGFPKPADAFLPLAEIQAILAPLGLQPVPPSGDGPAREFQLPGGMGRVGLISPVSEHFCGTCNRLRLTADGSLRPCLLHDVEIPLREALRRGEPLLPYLQQAADWKPAGHELALARSPAGRCMGQIGG